MVRPPTKRRKKKRPDSARLKRPPSSFLLYSQSRRKDVQAAHPGKPMQEITKTLGQEWRSLPLSRKAPFVEQARLLRDEYQEKLAAEMSLPTTTLAQHPTQQQQLPQFPPTWPSSRGLPFSGMIAPVPIHATPMQALEHSAATSYAACAGPIPRSGPILPDQWHVYH